MAQKALFFMDSMRLTQAANVGSHKGSLATDWGGASPLTVDPTYAPFDGTIIRIRTDGKNSHETYFQSDEPVQYANGVVDYLMMTIMHDDMIDVKEGQQLKRGEKLGDEGGFYRGAAYQLANHVHVEFSRGKYTKATARQTANSQGVYCSPHQVAIEDALFVPADCTVLSGGGLNWRYTDECLTEESIKPFSGEDVVVQIGVASSGDVHLLRQFADGLQLGFSATPAENGELVLIGPASSGDQIACIRIGRKLGFDPVQYGTSTDKQGRVEITADIGLRVRTGANLQSTQINSVHAGEQYNVLDEQNGWFFIDLTGEGAGGWVCADYVKEVA